MKRNSISAILYLDEKSENLMPLTKYRPIAGLPFDCRYRLIDFPLSSISNAGIDTVALFLSGSGRAIYDHLRSGRSWNLDSFHGGIFTFSQMDMKIERGGMHEINEDLIGFLKKSQSQYTIIMGSRMVNNIDIMAVFQHYRERGSDITVVYKSLAEASVDRDHNYVLSFNQKDEIREIIPAKDAETIKGRLAVSMDMYMIKTSALIELIWETDQAQSGQTLPGMLRDYVSQKKSSGFEYTGYLADISTIKQFYDANMGMLEEKNFNALFYSSQAIYTKAKNEVPAYYAKTSHVSYSQLGKGCFIEGRVEHSLLFRDVFVGKDAKVAHSIIMQGVRIEPGAHLDYVICDKGSSIESDVILCGTLDKPIVIEKNQRITKGDQG